MVTTKESLFASARKVLDLIPKLSVITAGFALAAMTGLIVAEVVGRGLFRVSIPFSIEYAEYLIPVIALWGAAYALSVRGHVRADIFVSRLSARPRLWFDLMGYIVGLAFVIILGIQTVDLVVTSFKFGYTSMYPLATPLGWARLVLPIGFSLFGLQLVVEIVRMAKLVFLSYKY